MQQNEHGLDFTAECAETVALFDTTVRQFLEYRLATAASLDRLISAEPGCVMAQCLKGYLSLAVGSVNAVPAANAALAAARAGAAAATAREQHHVAALAAWLDGDLAASCRAFDAVLFDHPHDLLALRLQHFNIFWQGRSLGLRDAVARVVPAWHEAMPGFGFVLAMEAFGLEEAGDYGAAETKGRTAAAINPDDLWALHAVAHVLEMQGRQADGLDWLDGPADQWDDRNAMKGHLWWHRAMFALELGRYDEVLALYDDCVWPPGSEFYLDQLNAVSMLARLEFRGVDVGDRWQALAASCEVGVNDHVLAFSDLHRLIALARTGRHDAVAEMQRSQAALAGRGGASTVAATMGPLTLPLGEALSAFYRGDYDSAVAQMLLVRDHLPIAGASHAQRDLFAQYLVVAAMRAGRWSTARALLAERVATRRSSRSSWRWYAEALDRTGAVAAAARARGHAA